MQTLLSVIILGLTALIYLTQRKLLVDNATAIAALTDATTQLATANASLDTANATLAKVSGETASLLQKITDLMNAAGNTQTTPEFDTALAALQAQAAAVGNAAAGVSASATGIDDQVPDATPAAG